MPDTEDNAAPPRGSVRQILACSAIAGVAALVLAGTHELTAERIDANRSAAERERIAALITMELPDGMLQWRGGELIVGAERVRRETVRGYGGAMTVLVGLSGNRISGVAVAGHTETPGLGDFFDYDGGAWLGELATAYPVPIDAVTGATITSDAIVLAVATAAEPEAP